VDLADGTGGREDPRQSADRRIALARLVEDDRRRRRASTPGQLPLGEPCMDPGVADGHCCFHAYMLSDPITAGARTRIRTWTTPKRPAGLSRLRLPFRHPGRGLVTRVGGA